MHRTPTRLWIMSDLHLESVPHPDAFDPHCPDFDVLVCAGDTWQGRTDLAFEALRRLAGDRPVVTVMGNHEHWNGEVGENLAEARLWAAAKDVTLLEGEEATIAGVRFVGATLWSDYRLAGPAVDRSAETGESVLVRHGDHEADDRWLTAASASALHATARAKLTELVDAHDDPAVPLVVITHHAPHPDCLDPKLLGRWAGGNCASDLSDLTDRGTIALWVHGHVHDTDDRTRPGGTRIVRNPAGNRFANAAFDEGFVVAI